MDAALRELTAWAADSRGELFLVAYHARAILRDQGGHYQAALTLEIRTMAVLRGGGDQARRDLLDHTAALRGLLRDRELHQLLDRLTYLVTTGA